jgi:hypothetical protein
MAPPRAGCRAAPLSWVSRVRCLVTRYSSKAGGRRRAAGFVVCANDLLDELDELRLLGGRQGTDEALLRLFNMRLDAPNQRLPLIRYMYELGAPVLSRRRERNKLAAIKALDDIGAAGAAMAMPTEFESVI